MSTDTQPIAHGGPADPNAASPPPAQTSQHSPTNPDIANPPTAQISQPPHLHPDWRTNIPPQSDAPATRAPPNSAHNPPDHLLQPPPLPHRPSTDTYPCPVAGCTTSLATASTLAIHIRKLHKAALSTQAVRQALTTAHILTCQHCQQPFSRLAQHVNHCPRNQARPSRPASAPAPPHEPAADVPPAPTAPAAHFQAELAEHPPLVDRIPNHARAIWTTIIGAMLTEYTNARNPTDKTTALERLLRITSHTLVRRRGGARGQGRRLLRQELLNTYNAIRQQREPDRPHREPNVNTNPHLSTDERQRRSNIHRARRLMESGKIARAARALNGRPMADATSPAVQAELARLHPQRDDFGGRQAPLPPQDHAGDYITLDPNDAPLRRKVAKWLDNGAAPGPSGMRGNYLHAAIDDDTCYRGILSILADIINGRMDERATQLLLTCVLYPTNKDKGGIRPIACGEVLVRVAGLIAFDAIRDEANTLFGPTQLGCGATGGSQVAAHLIQLAAHSPDTAVLLLDAVNAFNTISRAAILSRLYRHTSLRPVWQLAHWLLATPSRLLCMKDGRITHQLLSTTGVRQGCTLGPFLWALGVHDDLTIPLAASPSLHTDLVAILDNITIWGPPHEATALARAILARMQARGDILLSPKNEEVLWLHDSPLPNALAAYANERCERNPDGGVTQPTIITGDATAKVLGIPMGRNTPTVASHALRLARKNAHAFSTLSDERLPLQHAFALHRMCCSGMATYVLRCLPPAAAQSYAQWYVDQTSTFARQRLSIDLDNDTISTMAADHQHARLTCREAAELPIGLGGLGWSSTTHLSPVAFWAGFAQAAPALQHRARIQLVTNNPFIADALRDAWDSPAMRTVRANPNSTPILPNDSRPTTTASFYAAPTRPRRQRAEGDAPATVPAQQLQRALRTILTTTKREYFYTNLDIQGRARTEAGEGRCGYAWLTCLPTSSTTRLHDDAFRCGVRLKLGLQPFTDLPGRCVCGTTLADAPSHLLSCTHLRASGPTRKARHNDIQATIASRLRDVGLLVELEPRGLSRTNDHRPDHLIASKTITATSAIVLTDVTVTNTATTHRCVDDRDRLEEFEAQAKRNHYTAMAQALHATFIPLVINAYGHLHPEFDKFIQLKYTQVDAAAFSHFRGGRRGFINDFYAAISCSLQTGNHRTVQHTAQVARAEHLRLTGNQNQQLNPSAPVPPSAVGLQSPQGALPES